MHGKEGAAIESGAVSLRGIIPWGLFLLNIKSDPTSRHIRCSVCKELTSNSRRIGIECALWLFVGCDS